MKDDIIVLVALMVLSTPATGMAQATAPDPSPLTLVARLSYSRTSAVRSDVEGPTRVCFALYRSGRYRVLMDTLRGTQFFEGKLSQDQLWKLSKMLEDLDFRNSGVGTILQGSESFQAEVHRSGKTAYYYWLDPDHRRPFPKSATRVVDWLRDFTPVDASPLYLGEFSWQQVCPSDGPVLPLTAGLRHGGGASDCGYRWPESLSPPR